MRAKIINVTPKPIETAYWAFRNMHNYVPDEIPDFTCEAEKLKFLEILSQVPHQTVLEFVKLVIKIDGSRAFQQQLTRTRTAAYSIQSLRIVDVSNFAYEMAYHTPSGLDKKIEEMYHNSMQMIQACYRDLIERGAPVEVARGILPLNIESPITMAIDLRSLVHMMELRMCRNAQGEYRDFARQICAEVALKIDPAFSRIFFKPPCKKHGYCNSPAPCDWVPKKYKKLINIDPSEIGLK